MTYLITKYARKRSWLRYLSYIAMLHGQHSTNHAPAGYCPRNAKRLIVIGESDNM